jgi:hypothetical protein
MSGAMDHVRSESRHFRDGEGRAWQVFELRRRGPDGEAAKLLVFESSAAIRCVRRYPADWRELSQAKLEALSWGR